MHRFNIKGHKHILAKHETTLEFTKDKEVTLNGDCIAGVEADFDKEKLQSEFAYPKIEVCLNVGKNRFTFIATPNKQFNDDNELVFRKTDFLSNRTGGTKATKVACDIKKEIRKALQSEEKGYVAVTGLPIEYIFLDFDDTLCDFFGAMQTCHNQIAKQLAKKYKQPESRFHELLDTADAQFPKQASAKNKVELFDRHKWFEWILEKMKIPIIQEEINFWVKGYWACMISNSKKLPYAEEILQYLSKKYRLGMITDADGKKEYKLTRIKSTGLNDYFESIAFGDELRVVKPHPNMFNYLLRQFKAKPEQCVMIGDKPWGDLLTAKKMGMMTVWIKHGIYAKQIEEVPDYVDYVITNLAELKEIL